MERNPGEPRGWLLLPLRGRVPAAWVDGSCEVAGPPEAQTKIFAPEWPPGAKPE